MPFGFSQPTDTVGKRECLAEVRKTKGAPQPDMVFNRSQFPSGEIIQQPLALGIRHRS